MLINRPRRWLPLLAYAFGISSAPAQERADIVVRPSPALSRTNESSRRAQDAQQQRWDRTAHRVLRSVCAGCDASANRAVPTPFLLDNDPNDDNDGPERPPSRLKLAGARPAFLLPGVALLQPEWPVTFYTD